MLSYSQNSYPKRIVIEGTPVTLLLDSQVIEINHRLVEGDFLKKENQDLKIYKESCTDVLGQKDMIIEYQDSLSKTEQQQIATLNAIILSQKKNIGSWEEIAKTEKKKKIRAYFLAGSGGAAIGLLIGVLLPR